MRCGRIPAPFPCSMAALSEQAGDGLPELVFQQGKQGGVDEGDHLQALHPLAPASETAGPGVFFRLVEAEGLLHLPAAGEKQGLGEPVARKKRF